MVSAQNRFSVTPWVGSYYAIGTFYDNDLANGLRVRVNQSNTVMFGLRAAVPLGPTLAVEGSFGYARSAVNFRLKKAITDTISGQSFDASTDLKGSVIIGSLRAVFRPRRSNLSLIAGAVLANHGGDAWSDSTITKKTSFGGVIGIGLRSNVTPRFPIDFRAELNLYNFNPDKSDDTSLGFYPSKLQEDLVFSVGIPLGGH
jgi:hypothetical protein